jgi:hypothetical protein
VKIFVQPNVALVADSKKIIYNAPMPSGAYIQHIDGSLYTADQWSANGFTSDAANGVAVIDERAKFVIAKTGGNALVWAQNTSALIDGVFASQGQPQAETDYAGDANTVLITAAGTGGAASFCANFEFPNGAKGYLPALGEWVVAYEYKADITMLMSLVGSPVLENLHWSSTQSTSNKAWYFAWHSGNSASGGKNSTAYVRPFAPLSI